MTPQELFEEVKDIKLAIEARARELKMEYRGWDDNVRRASAEDPNLPTWRENAERARQRLGQEPNAMTEAVCRLVERELRLMVGEVEQRNNYATNEGFNATQWAHYLVFGNRTA